MQERQKQIEDIVNFVNRNRNSHASLTICSRVLGNDFLGIDRQTINELRTKLPGVDEDELESYYYIIK